MCPISKTTFKEWQTEQLKDPEFAAIARELEPGYQIARLRIARGLTQAQLAELVGTHQPSIARIENGKSLPSLSFLRRVAAVLNARVEVHILPR
ncbi:MAG: helix-turn-helix transcriptional regulator [Chloroflexota bacterium]